MGSLCRSFYLQLCCLLLVNLVYGSQEFQNRVLQYMGHTNMNCFGQASRYLIRFRRLQVRTINELWVLMERLSLGNIIPQYNDAYFHFFNDFQKMYVDCLVGRELGIGKRHAESKRSVLYADKKPYKTP